MIEYEDEEFEIKDDERSWDDPLADPMEDIKKVIVREREYSYSFYNDYEGYSRDYE